MRSLLFVPGDDERKLARASDCGADVLIIDLEDSVADGRKAIARDITLNFILGFDRAVGPKLYVRINPLNSEFHDGDLDAIIPAAPDGVVVPKAEGGRDIQQLGARLAVREAESAIADGATRILAIATETARSLFHMGSYAGSSHRLAGLAWGGEDLAADIGAETNKTPEGRYGDPYRLARTLTLLAGASAGVAAIDSVFTDFRDGEALRAEAQSGRRDGFSGKMAIHPAQVPIINEVFTPSREAIEHAQEIIAAFAADPDAGVIGIRGKMIDKPHLRQAERIIARAGGLT